MLNPKLKIIFFSSMILVFLLIYGSPILVRAQSKPTGNQQIEALKTELAKNPESSELHFELAKKFYNIQQQNDAQRHFLAVLGIDPKHAEAYAYLGHIYLNQNKHQQAITFFQQALKWQPNNQLALTGLKQIQSQQKLISQLQEIRTTIAQEKWTEAQRQLLEIPMQAKKLTEFRRLRQEVAQHFYEQGNLYFRAENWTTAQKFFAQLEELLPDYLDTSQKLQVIAEKLNPQNELTALYRAGNQAFQRQEWSQALRYFEQILKIDKNYRDTRDKWQAAFAARDAASTVVPPDTIEPPPEDTAAIQFNSEPDSEKLMTQSANTINLAEAPSAPRYQKLLGKYYWIIAPLLLVLWLLLRQISKKNKQPRKRKRNQVKPASDKKSEQTSVKTVPEIKSKVPETIASAPPVQKAGSPYKRFELKEELVRFDQVHVFLARDRRLNRQVLIDRIALNSTGSSAKQIITGVQTAANLSHPNIIRVEDVFFKEDVVFIVMEHVPGIALTEMLTGRKPENLLKSIQIIRDCCLALSYAHRHDVFHANLHPFYVKIINEDTIKLGGFELATLRNVQKETTKQLSDLIAYQSPEQLRNGQTDARSDIFSLGIIFYELLTLTNPFQGDSSAAVVFNILEGNPISPRELNPDIPRDLDQLVMKMLAKNRGDRYFNAFDIALELKKYL